MKIVRSKKIVGKVASDLGDRDVTAAPPEILKLLHPARIYVRNRHYSTAAHDLLKDHFAALVVDRE